MGMTKEEFVERMLRAEHGKKQTRLNKAIREGKQKYYNADAHAFRTENRIRRTKQKRVDKRY